jgi:hypothetical protein
MKYFLLTDSPSDPVPDSSVPKEQRRKWLLECCIAFVNKYIMNQERITPLVEKVEELETAGNSKFPCRVQNCDKTYTYHSLRVK